MADGMLALTWNNHSSTFLKTLSTVRQKERYTDVTLSCGGKFYQLHKIILSSCSAYFEQVFEQTPCKHPVIVLRDVTCFEIEALLNYMYLGSVSVAQNDLSRLIKVAELFQIKGLAVPDEPPKNESSSLPKRSDNRDSRISSQNRRSASDSRNSPLAKKRRTSENYTGLEHVDRETSNVLHSEYSQSSEAVPGVPASDERAKFEVPIKEELVHDITDSEPECYGDNFDEPVAGYDSMSNSASLEPFIPKSEPEEVPPDGEALTQPVLETDGYSEPLQPLPGPSDAQGWYSEGDSTGGGGGSLSLGGKGVGGLGDDSQEMLPMEMTQQQQMMSPVNAFLPDHHQYDVERTEKVLQCPDCPCTTSYKINYTNHLLIHKGDKPHQCPHCPSSFARKSTLTRHLQTHTGERPYQCPLCCYRAARRSSLQSHTLRRHGNVENTLL